MTFYRRAMHTALLVVATLAACASAPDVTYVTDSDTRIQRNGFSLLPPAGKGWMTAPSGQYGARWGKLLADSQGNRSTVTLLVWAGRFKERKVDLTTPEGLRDTAVYQVIGSDRYAVRQVKYSDVYQKYGTDCIDADYIAEDRENTMSWNAGTVLVLDVHVTLCRHPHNPEWGFNAAFSDRRPAGSASLIDDVVRKEATRCLDSIQLTPIS